jgi:hypothetical protein
MFYLLYTLLGRSHTRSMPLAGVLLEEAEDKHLPWRVPRWISGFRVVAFSREFAAANRCASALEICYGLIPCRSGFWGEPM